jgi:two-component system response regulator YesN
MYKLLIADDEPKIRNGLKKMLDYSRFGIEVVGEADDGEVALREVTEKNPDILFLDICMPFLNGLDLIRKLKENVQQCVIIIISGYDQFAYMQEAIKLQVFDYLLKPITRSGLEETLQRVCEELNRQRGKEQYFQWVNERLNENLDTVREKFFLSLLKAPMSEQQISGSINYLNIHMEKFVGITVCKLMKRSGFSHAANNPDRNLLLYGIRNITSELLGTFSSVCLYDESENIVIIAGVSAISEWPAICGQLNCYIEDYVGGSVITSYEAIHSFQNISETYKRLSADIRKKASMKPITTSIIRYIEDNCYKNDFSLEQTAQKFQITPAYLSKLLKTETGDSFIDVLTKVRIQKAIAMMSSSPLKIYEIAELVGYSNQYYFSRAFKKITGVSPVQYKEGKGN